MHRCGLAFLVAGLFPAIGWAVDDFTPEPGYTLLLSGDTLDGWKLSRGALPLDGTSETGGGRIVLRNGVLVIDPKVKAAVRIHTAREYTGDATLRLEFKPGPGCDNDFYFRGQKFDLKKGDLRNLKEGEWNKFEVIVTGETAESFCNGEPVKKLKAKPGSAPLRIIAEFGPVEIRRLRVKEAK